MSASAEASGVHRKRESLLSVDAVMRRLHDRTFSDFAAGVDRARNLALSVAGCIALSSRSSRRATSTSFGTYGRRLLEDATEQHLAHHPLVRNRNRKPLEKSGRRFFGEAAQARTRGSSHTEESPAPMLESGRSSGRFGPRNPAFVAFAAITASGISGSCLSPSFFPSLMSPVRTR